MVQPPKRRPSLLHGAAFSGGLALLAAAAPAFPYDFCDVRCYLFSLEEGTWAPLEWMHPLWVPLLSGYRGLLVAFGFHGPLPVPIGALNMALSFAALGLIFDLTRRATRDPWAALAAMLTTSACTPFVVAAVRDTPYALAFLCVTASVSLLVSDGPVARRRYAAAGALAGIATGLHVAAMALALVAVACAACEPNPGVTRAKKVERAAAFVASMLASASACWALFVARNRITLDYFRTTQLSTAFPEIEQEAASSIYSSHSALKQVSDLAKTLLENAPICVVAGGLLLLAFGQCGAVAAGSPRRPIERRLRVAIFANLAALGAFFLINNTKNGFVYASLALMPAVLALSAVRLRGGRALFLALASTCAVVQAARGFLGKLVPYDRTVRDPLVSEVRYLREQLGVNDTILTPSCPLREMTYVATINLVEVRPPGFRDDLADACHTPHACIDDSLHDRVEWWIANGGRVWLAVGDEATESGDVGVSNPSGPPIFRDARLAAVRLAGVRSALNLAGLSLGQVITSPTAQRYVEVRPRPTGLPPVALPRSSAAVPMTVGQVRAALGSRSPWSYRARVLADRETTQPGDPWRACDLMQLVCQAGLSREGVAACEPIAGCDACDSPAIPEQGPPMQKASGAGDVSEPRCLSARVGEILSARLAGHAFDAALPPGWRLESIAVRAARIELDALDERGRPRGVALRLGGDAGEVVDGRGRFFAFVLDARAAPLDGEAKRGLLELAARVEAAVPEDEVRRTCAAWSPGSGNPPDRAGQGPR